MALMIRSEARGARAEGPLTRTPVRPESGRTPAVRSTEPVRWDKVLQARQQLADNVYEDPTVLDFAVDKLLKKLEVRQD